MATTDTPIVINGDDLGGPGKIMTPSEEKHDRAEPENLPAREADAEGEGDSGSEVGEQRDDEEQDGGVVVEVTLN